MGFHLITYFLLDDIYFHSTYIDMFRYLVPESKVTHTLILYSKYTKQYIEHLQVIIQA